MLAGKLADRGIKSGALEELRDEGDNSNVRHFVDIEGVTGSIPVAPTI